MRWRYRAALGEGRYRRPAPGGVAPQPGGHRPHSRPQPNRSATASPEARPGPAPSSPRRSSPRSAGGGPGGGAQGSALGPSVPRSPFFQERGKKKYTPNGCRKRRSRQSPPQRAASLCPSPRTGKKRKADRTKAISKSNVQPQPTLMRPPPRALRAAHAIPSRSPPPLTQRAPHGTIRTPAGSRELPQPPPRRPFIAAPISRGDGRGAPGPFLPSRLPGPPAEAAWLGTTRPLPDSRSAPYLRRAVWRPENGSAQRLDGGRAAPGKQPAERLEAAHGRMSQMAESKKWL